MKHQAPPDSANLPAASSIAVAALVVAIAAAVIAVAALALSIVNAVRISSRINKKQQDEARANITCSGGGYEETCISCEKLERIQKIINETGRIKDKER